MLPWRGATTAWGWVYGVDVIDARSLHSTMGVSDDDYIRAIYRAVDHGADVINISYGSDDTVAERRAIEYALESGRWWVWPLLVTAARAQVSNTRPHCRE